jgi:hypothetical protein
MIDEALRTAPPTAAEMPSEDELEAVLAEWDARNRGSVPPEDFGFRYGVRISMAILLRNYLLTRAKTFAKVPIPTVEELAEALSKVVGDHIKVVSAKGGTLHLEVNHKTLTVAIQALVFSRGKAASVATQKFVREQRYVVLKVSDIKAAAISVAERDVFSTFCEKVAHYRTSYGKKPLECVVVENDWPEYEPTFRAIEARMTGKMGGQ